MSNVKLFFGALMLFGAISHGTSGAAGIKELTPFWVAPLASKGPPLHANGRVFVWGFPAGKLNASYRIYALDAKNGNELWSIPAGLEPAALTASPSEFLSLGYAGKSIVLRSPGASPRVLDASNGREIPESASKDIAALQRMIVDGDLVYAVDQKTHQVRGLRAQDAATVWKVEVPLERIGPARPFGPHQLFFAEGHLIVVTPFQWATANEVRETRFLASVYHAKSGKWLYDLLPGGDVGQPKPPGRSGPDPSKATLSHVSAVEGRLLLTIAQGYVRIRDNGRSETAMQTLAAFDLASGRSVWTLAPGGDIIDRNETEITIAVRTLDSQFNSVNYLAGIELASGRVLWRRDQPETWPIECAVVNHRAWTALQESQRDTGRSYTGDRRDSKILPGGWTANTVTSTLIVKDLRTGAELGRSKALKGTQMSDVVAGDGMVFVSTVAEMAEGRSGVWAYRAID